MRSSADCFVEECANTGHKRASKFEIARPALFAAERSRFFHERDGSLSSVMEIRRSAGVSRFVNSEQVHAADLLCRCWRRRFSSSVAAAVLAAAQTRTTQLPNGCSQPLIVTSEHHYHREYVCHQLPSSAAVDSFSCRSVSRSPAVVSATVCRPGQRALIADHTIVKPPRLK